MNHIQNIKIVKYSISDPPIDGVVQSIKEKTFSGYIRNVDSSKAYKILFQVISVLITDNVNYYNLVVETFLKRFALSGTPVKFYKCVDLCFRDVSETYLKHF